MTLILELTPDQEKQLTLEAAREGIDAQTYALRRLFSEEGSYLSGPSLADRLRTLGIAGAIEGSPRPDGRNRSEVEGACDTAH